MKDDETASCTLMREAAEVFEYEVNLRALVSAVQQIETAVKQIEAFRGEEVVDLLRQILHRLNFPNRVLGGVMTQIGDPVIAIQPGNSPKFQVTPTFSGPAFPLLGPSASITTSDSVNAPASIDLTDDPTGATFALNLTAGAVIAPGGEALTVDWAYANADTTVAHVTGTVTEEGIVDDVTGGTFAQVA